MAHRVSSRGFLVVATALAIMTSSAHAATVLRVAQLLIDDKPGAESLEGASDVALSPGGGAFAYVAVRNDSALVVYSRDAGTGFLTLVEAERDGVAGADGLLGAEGVALTPDGAHVYVASAEGIGVWSRDGGTGEVTFVDVTATTFPPNTLVVSPDGGHVYAVTDVPSSDGRVMAFSRDAGTGELTFVQELIDDQGGVDGIERSRGVTISPDGLHVYATGSFDDGVAAFERDGVTGELAFLAAYIDGAGGIDGMRRPTGITVSPDGDHVYVGPSDDGLVVFSRDAGTGLLTFVESQQAGGEATLRGGVDVAVSTDGALVFAAAQNDGVAVYARDAGTGKLTRLAEETLEDANCVTPSDDNAFVYTASNGSDLDAVGVLRLAEAGCSATPQVACLQPTVALKSSVDVKKHPDTADRDKFGWKWLKGPALTLGDFGDPVTGTDDVVVCAYDASGAPQPVFEAVIPAGGVCKTRPCWKQSGTATLKYKNALLLPHGIVSVSMKAGVAAGLSSIKVKGKRRPLPMPDLPLTTPVTVQLQSEGGTCWETVHSNPRENSVLRFQAKAD